MVPEARTVASRASSISHLAGAANSKRATFLREQEEREAALFRKGRRGRDLSDKTGRPKRQSRFSAAASFSKPTPLVERQGGGGTRPFHFEVTTVSRPLPSSVTADGSDGGKGAQPGFDHANYIERDGAVEPGADEAYEDYLGRPGALEEHGSTMPGGSLDEMEALPGIPELDAFGPAPVVGGKLSVVSNISDDPGERKRFWKLVQDHERETHTASLVANPFMAPQWWQALLADRDLNRDLHAHLVLEHSRSLAHREAGLKTQFTPKPFNVPVAKAASYLHALQYVDGGRETPPVAAKTRAGRVQKRLVIEMPYQVTPDQRMEMLRAICRKLEHVEQDERGRWVGWMYTGVIHAPDGQNDSRNFHAHIIAHDRPCRYLVEHAEWDFAVQDTYEHRGELRTRYPHCQPKLACVSQSGRAKDRQGRSLAGRADVGRNYFPHLRGQVADAINEVLEREGYELRFHPGTNKRRH